MTGHRLVQCYFLWTAQRYYNQVLAFIKILIYAKHTMCAKRRPSVL